ncbi:MAG: glycoside hydrolase family 88 protein [Clostridia bacterium]|nr:glycoside hydrolase family 88 protein [Clostridia bacterium]
MSYQEIIKSNQYFINSTFEKLDNKLSRTAVDSRYKIPYTTINGVHDDKKESNITWWTNGFWGGLMWLMYIATKKDCYKITAEESEKILDKAFSRMEWLDHDVGFTWHILSGVNYRLTGSVDSKNRNLIAAMSLMSRYNIDGEFIRCWNYNFDTDVSGWSIIDCMMNLPLLYWASDVVKDERFKKVAMRHADMTLKDHIREDGSVNHIVMHDTNKPNTVLGVHKGQGYSETSCWSRGASWALYGFVISYIHTKEQRYLDTAIKVADNFIKETEKTNWLPRIDFKQPKMDKYYDSTAGAIASCGLIELAKILDNDEYLTSAINILKAMDKAWCNYESNEDSILQNGSSSYERREMPMPIIYGDYFFVEAMLKLKGEEFLPW